MDSLGKYSWPLGGIYVLMFWGSVQRQCWCKSDNNGDELQLVQKRVLYVLQQQELLEIKKESLASDMINKIVALERNDAIETSKAIDYGCVKKQKGMLCLLGVH